MSPSLTIIGLNFAPEPTGNAPYTTSLATNLAEMGWTVKVIAGFPHYPGWRIYEGYSGSYCRERAGRAEVLRMRHYVPRHPRFVNRMLMELDFGFKAARIDWGQPDVVLFVSQALFSSGIARFTVRFRASRPKTAIWVQDLYTRTFEEAHASASGLALPMRGIERRILASMDKVVVIHDRFRKYACEVLRLREDQVEVIRNWSHITPPFVPDRPALRGRFGWHENDVIVLHAGNMGVKQGLGNVVEAARLAESRGSSVKFVLLGGGNQRSRLETLGSGLSRLQFLDPLPDEEYSSALAAADILLVNEIPSVREMSVPSKLTSYFVTGRPVLAAVERDGATASEVIASGAGTVIRSGRPDVLLDAAESLGADPKAFESSSRNGPRYAADHLSTQAAVLGWNATLRSLLRG